MEDITGISDTITLQHLIGNNYSHDDIILVPSLLTSCSISDYDSMPSLLCCSELDDTERIDILEEQCQNGDHVDDVLLNWIIYSKCTKVEAFEVVNLNRHPVESICIETGSNCHSGIRLFSHRKKYLLTTTIRIHRKRQSPVQESKCAP